MRLSFIALLTFALSACGNSGSPAPSGGGVTPAPGSEQLTVAVVVVDSLMPDEITAATPNLQALKAGGTFYAESRSVFSAETIPNHVAMMTGVYPARNGIVTNNFLDFGVTPVEERDLSVPEELTANTLFTWIKQQCVDSGINPDIRTAATLSKKYLFEVFEGDAANPARANRNPRVNNVAPDTHWDPRSSPLYLPSPDEHTPDLPTMQQALTQLPGADFIFINLGDVDRSAHAAGPVPRAAVLSATDAQIGQLVDALETSGRWANTVMFLVSDHGMDFSLPISFISTQSTLDALGSCFAPMQAVDNGGTNSIYVTDRSLPLADRRAALRAARACLLGTADCNTLCAGASRPLNAANIESAWYTTDDAGDAAGNMPANTVSRHPNLGDLVLAAVPGFRFSEPNGAGNPIPGNHGHPVTLHNTFLVTGGSPWVKKGVTIAPSVPAPALLDRLPEQSENVDIAPTVNWLLGLGIRGRDFPEGSGFDGRILKEAFTPFDASANAPSPTVCGRF